MTDSEGARTRVMTRLSQRRALLARLYGWRKRTENQLGRLLLQHRYRPPDAPEVVKRVDELIATRQAISDEIASLKGQAK